MTVSLYVMPITGAGVKGDPRRPKYAGSTLAGFSWDMWDYGDEPWCLCGVVDISAAANTSLSGQPDVFALPANLDTTMGNTGTRNTTRNRLESVNIPGSWVQTTTTYREVVRCVGGCCQFNQRCQGMGSGVLFTSGITLDSTFGTLSAAKRQIVLDAGASFEMDRSTWTTSATMRTVMKSAADQYVATHTLSMGGVAL